MDVIFILIVYIFVLALLGIIVSFSPTLVITEVAILTKSKKPLIHSIALISGITLAVFFFSLVSILFVDPNKEINLPSTRETIGSLPLLDILIGILLAVAGLRMLRQPPTEKAKESRFSPKKLLSTKTLFWFGLLKMATSLSSIAAILYASRFIKTFIDKEPQQFVAVFWLVIISVAPFVLIAGIEKLRPDIFKRINSATDRVSNINWRRYIAFMLLSLGILMITYGVVNH